MAPKLKHIRSSIADIRNLFSSSIEVNQISSRLELCGAQKDVGVARQIMNDNGFDVLGVENSGNVHSYVKLSALQEGSCSDSEIIFHPSDLLAGSTP